MVINAEHFGLGRIPLAFFVLKDSENASFSLLMLNLFKGYSTLLRVTQVSLSDPAGLRKPCPKPEVGREGGIGSKVK